MTVRISRRQSHNRVNVRFRKRSANEGVSPANPGVQKTHRRGIVASGNDPSREIADELPLLARIKILDCVHDCGRRNSATGTDVNGSTSKSSQRAWSQTT